MKSSKLNLRQLKEKAKISVQIEVLGKDSASIIGGRIVSRGTTETEKGTIMYHWMDTETGECWYEVCYWDER